MSRDYRRSSGLIVIRVARFLFANTSVQRLKLTTNIYTRVFRFAARSEEVIVKLRGLGFVVPTNDITISPGLLGGFYERIELDVFECLAAVSNTVLDVGANIGLYSCVAAKTGNECDKHVVAFEPVMSNLDYLKRNLIRNHAASAVVVEELAVGDSHGELEIYLAAGSIGTHSSSAQNVGGAAQSVRVPVISLDEYAMSNLQYRPVDLVKIDVEGYEGFVLRGACEILARDKPTLLVEFVPDHLINCGFSVSEFLDILFECYDLIYLIDEPRKRIELCSKSSLAAYSGNIHKNVNLVAISSFAHSAHVRSVEDIVGAYARR